MIVVHSRAVMPRKSEEHSSQEDEMTISLRFHGIPREKVNRLEVAASSGTLRSFVELKNSHVDFERDRETASVDIRIQESIESPDSDDEKMVSREMLDDLWDTLGAFPRTAKLPAQIIALMQVQVRDARENARRALAATEGSHPAGDGWTNADIRKLAQTINLICANLELLIPKN